MTQELKNWEDEFDKLEFIGSWNKPSQDDIKSFIRTILSEAKEEGVEEGLARGLKDFCNEEIGFKKGQAQTLTEIKEKIEEAKDDIISVKPLIVTMF